MKSTLLNAGIIIGASVVIALVYNVLSPQPLDLVRKKIVLPSAADSTLFADAPQSQTATGDTVVAVQPVEQDNVETTPVPEKNTAATQEKAAQPQAEQPVASHAPAEKPEEKITAKEVTYDQVLRLSKDPNVLFIDARNADEYGQGHIGNARNYFTHDFEKHIPEIVQIDREKRIVVYCGGGACELSHEMADNLLTFGFKRVFVYTGGWDEWKKKQGAN